MIFNKVGKSLSNNFGRLQHNGFRLFAPNQHIITCARQDNSNRIKIDVEGLLTVGIFSRTDCIDVDWTKL